jgi:hypothetical protein
MVVPSDSGEYRNWERVEMHRKNICLSWILLSSVCLFLVSTSQATVVYVLDDAGYGGPIGGFYSGLYGGPGVSTEYISGALNDYSFSGTKLLWVVPGDAFTSDEMSTMETFLSNGGHIGFLGGGYWFAGVRDENINTAVASLGGHITINSNWTDTGYPHSVDRNSGGIVSDPFTEGVNSFVFGPFSPLSLGGSAKSLILGTDGSSIQLATENIGTGTIFVMGGQTAWDLDPFTLGSDNRTLFTNILTIPEPCTLALLALGGLAVSRRHKRGKYKNA